MSRQRPVVATKPVKFNSKSCINVCRVDLNFMQYIHSGISGELHQLNKSV
jgi:hypothetical protein